MEETIDLNTGVIEVFRIFILSMLFVANPLLWLLVWSIWRPEEEDE